jgi:hypothetical protein
VESMLRKEEKKRNEREEFCVEDFVPADHLLRKIEEAVNFSYIYELVEDLYCENNGRSICME